MLTVKEFWNLAHITLRFGAPGRLYTIWKGRHAGVDIGTNRQAIDVPALVSGEVVRVVKTSAMAWVVVLDVGGDRDHAYCHLSGHNLPRVGDRIDQGERVAKLAAGPISVGPENVEFPGTAWEGIHLHFVVTDHPDGAYTVPVWWKKRARLFDPEPVIRTVLAGLGKKPVGQPASVKPSKPSKPAVSVSQIVTTAKGLNLRATRSTTAKVLKVIPKSTIVTTTGATDGWEHVTYKGTTGWADAKYLIMQRRTVAAAGGLKLRAIPSPVGRKVGLIPNGAPVIITATDGDTEASAWRKITYKGVTGWVAGRYLK